MQNVLKAADGTKVILTNHAKERAAERGMGLGLIQHTIDNGELVVSEGGKMQWHAAMHDGKSRSVLALDIRGGKVIVPTMWIRGPLAKAA